MITVTFSPVFPPKIPLFLDFPILKVYIVPFVVPLFDLREGENAMAKLVISILVLWMIMMLFVLGRPDRTANAEPKQYSNGVAVSGKWRQLK